MEKKDVVEFSILPYPSHVAKKVNLSEKLSSATNIPLLECFYGGNGIIRVQVEKERAEEFSNCLKDATLTIKDTGDHLSTRIIGRANKQRNFIEV